MHMLFYALHCLPMRHWGLCNVKVLSQQTRRGDTIPYKATVYDLSRDNTTATMRTGDKCVFWCERTCSLARASPWTEMIVSLCKVLHSSPLAALRPAENISEQQYNIDTEQHCWISEPCLLAHTTTKAVLMSILCRWRYVNLTGWMCFLSRHGLINCLRLKIETTSQDGLVEPG